jgi:hypothetical protein
LIILSNSHEGDQGKGTPMTTTKAKKTARKSGKKSLTAAQLAKVAGGFGSVNVNAQTTVAAANATQTGSGNTNSSNGNTRNSGNSSANRSTSNSHNRTSTRNSNNIGGNSVNVSGTISESGFNNSIKF